MSEVQVDLVQLKRSVCDDVLSYCVDYMTAVGAAPKFGIISRRFSKRVSKHGLNLKDVLSADERISVKLKPETGGYVICPIDTDFMDKFF